MTKIDFMSCLAKQDGSTFIGLQPKCPGMPSMAAYIAHCRASGRILIGNGDASHKIIAHLLT